MRSKRKPRLSQRLLRVAEQIPQGMTVADIGTDHAFLPVYLLLRKISPRVIGVEAKPGPLETARRQAGRFGLKELLDLRQGDGLGALRPGEAEAAVIAGLGGENIAAILRRAPAGVLKNLKLLVLQPMNDADLVRKWLEGSGWEIIDEDLVRENGFFYPVIKAAPDKEAEETEEMGAKKLRSEKLAEQMGISRDAVLKAGPLLVSKNHPLLPSFLAYLLVSYQRVLKQLQQSSNLTARKKQEEVAQFIKDLERLRDYCTGLSGDR